MPAASPQPKLAGDHEEERGLSLEQAPSARVKSLPTCNLLRGFHYPALQTLGLLAPEVRASFEGPWHSFPWRGQTLGALPDAVVLEEDAVQVVPFESR